MASYHLSRPIFFTFAVDEKYNQFNRTNYQIPRHCTMCWMFTQTTEEAFLAVSYLKISHKSRAEDPGVKGLFPFFMCFIFIYLFFFFFYYFYYFGFLFLYFCLLLFSPS